LQAHGGLPDSIVVLFDFGAAAVRHKALCKNSNDAIRRAAKQEKSLSKAPSEPDSISGIHGVVIDRDWENEMQVTMKDRVAVVTGGSKGIGFAVARRFAGAGAKVAILARGAQDLKAAREQLGKDGLVVRDYVCDVSKAADIASAHDKIVSDLGPVDILINNAGITRDSVFKRMTEQDWMAVINTNLNSVFNVTRQVIDGMSERGWGRIINISSVNAIKGQFGQTNYSAAKAGMAGFSKALAQEVVRKGVTVNTVSPGYVETDMVMAIRQEIRDQIVASIPMGRLAKPEEIAAVVAFLASEEAGYITGANISVNGGMHMM
jgi:acetoacetyl-CoA reductase